MNIGDKYKNRNGLIGTVENIRGVSRLVVRDRNNRITQTINLKEIDLSKFEKVEK